MSRHKLTSLPLFASLPGSCEIASTPEVEALVASGAPVAIGVSGGKDSCSVALATVDYLDRVGHAGPRLLIHADLGVTEWADSLPTCERLASRLGLELVVVRRKQGDMMDRWEQRWRDNVRRWESLCCVKLILPWSTPSMRFCTAELKVDQICRYLCKRFPGQNVLNVTGIRREESTERSKALTCKEQPKLESITHGTTGLDWLPIADWTEADVYAYLAEKGFPLHEAYTRYGASRVSCIWCIMSTLSDHLAATKAAENLATGRRMVDLEITSTFAFQGSRWLGDTIASILSPDQRVALAEAKARGERRERAESRIPQHLLYVKGWPTCVPSRDEAALLGAVRFAVADAVGLQKTFVDADSIIARYEQLMVMKELKELKGKRKQRRQGAA